MVLITPPTGGVLSQDPAKPTGLSNPLLQFGDGLTTTAGIIIQVMNTPAALEQLGAPIGGPVTITVDSGQSNPNLLNIKGPFMYIQAESASAETAIGTVLRAQQLARDELLKRQDEVGAPPSTFLVLVDVVAASPPQALLGAKWQAAGGVLVAGVVFGLTGAYGVQRVRSARHRKAAADAGGDPDTLGAGPTTVQFEPMPGQVGSPEPATPNRGNGAGLPAEPTRSPDKR
jgi:hypothetical protein